MTDELRGHAVAILASVKKRPSEITGGFEYVNDVDAQHWGLREPYELAKAYLAEHPADDAVRVTADWLSACGLVWKDAWQMWVTEGQDQCIGVFASTTEPGVWSVQYESDFHWPHDIRSRGYFRVLMRMLDVTLKDQP